MPPRAAAAGTDYTAASGALTFQAGERTKAVAVALLDDTLRRARGDVHAAAVERLGSGDHRRRGSADHLGLIEGLYEGLDLGPVRFFSIQSVAGAVLGVSLAYIWYVRLVERRPVDELSRQGALPETGAGLLVGVLAARRDDRGAGPASTRRAKRHPERVEAYLARCG